jgi:class 3 adenylate cyclase
LRVNFRFYYKIGSHNPGCKRANTVVRQFANGIRLREDRVFNSLRGGQRQVADGNGKSLSGEQRKSDRFDPLSLGSIRTVSIVFADIVGSTQRIRNLDPEDARDVLDGAIRSVSDAVHAYGGYVARIQGDGVMAIFGMIATLEDHALRAALAACKMRDAANAQGDLLLRIGIHSGSILMRWQQDDFGRILDAVGPTAHVAGQVEKTCPPGKIAISSDALALIDEPVKITRLATQSSAALGEETTVYLLDSVELARADSLLVKGKATLPLFGRDDALARVRQTLLMEGPKARLAIVGDPGIGKSRLLSEAMLDAKQFEQRCVTVRGVQVLRDVPFGSLTPSLRYLVDSAAGNLSQSQLKKMLTYDEYLCLSALLFTGDSEPVNLPPDERNRLIKLSVSKVISWVSGRTKLLLLIDDVQNLDTETQDLLELLLQQANNTSLAILFAGRPETVGWFERVGVDVLSLTPLANEHAQSLVASILGDQATVPGLADMITSRSGGLPLALEEFASFARANSAQESQTSNDLPPRLESLFLSRMHKLESDAVEIYLHCSALGQAMTAPRLNRICQFEPPRFANAMAELLESRLFQTDLAGNIGFTHQLAHEVAYKSMSRGHRGKVHARIYEALSEVEFAPTVSHSELARHAEAATLHDAALGHLYRACQEANSLAAIEAVQAIFNRAKAICKLLGDQGTVQSAKFALMAFDAMQQLSFEAELRDDLQEIVEGKVKLGDDALILALVHMGMLSWVAGKPDAGKQYCNAALTRLAGHKSLPMVVYANFALANNEFVSGEPRAALGRLNSICEMLADAHKTARFGSMISIPGILARSFGAWYACDLGEFAVAEEYSAFVLEHGEILQHDYSRLLSQLADGYLKLRKGYVKSAAAILRNALELCKRQNFMGLEAITSSWLVLALVENGELAEARIVIDASKELANFPRVQIGCQYYHMEAEARVLAAEGDLARARALLNVGIELCEDHGDTLHALHGMTALVELGEQYGQSDRELKAKAEGVANQIGALGILQRLHVTRPAWSKVSAHGNRAGSSS